MSAASGAADTINPVSWQPIQWAPYGERGAASGLIGAAGSSEAETTGFGPAVAMCLAASSEIRRESEAMSQRMGCRHVD